MKDQTVSLKKYLRATIDYNIGYGLTYRDFPKAYRENIKVTRNLNSGRIIEENRKYNKSKICCLNRNERFKGKNYNYEKTILRKTMPNLGQNLRNEAMKIIEDPASFQNIPSQNSKVKCKINCQSVFKRQIKFKQNESFAFYRS